MSSKVIQATELRPAGPDDLNFILSSWLKSYRRSDFAKGITNQTFFRYHQDLINQILRQNEVTILASAEDDTQILGYMVHASESPIIYFTYVKNPFRRMGLCRHMYHTFAERFEDDIKIHCTHRLPLQQWNALTERYNLDYNPYIASA